MEGSTPVLKNIRRQPAKLPCSVNVCFACQCEWLDEHVTFNDLEILAPISQPSVSSLDLSKDCDRSVKTDRDQIS